MSFVDRYMIEDLEILVATQDRNSLEFLYKMFPEKECHEYKILVVNQTDRKRIISEQQLGSNVRVINSFDKGISKSRNLALQNAIGKIILIADDDVVYTPGFEKKIISSFNSYSFISFAIFKIAGLKGIDYKEYPTTAMRVNKSFAERTSSIELALKIDDFRANNIGFNTNFGLGSFFIVGEEFLFLMEALNKGLQGFFIPATIVVHESESTGKGFANNKVIYARAALSYMKNGNLAYLWLIKYVFFLLRNRLLTYNKIFPAMFNGLKGIKKYKDIKTKYNE